MLTDEPKNAGVSGVLPSIAYACPTITSVAANSLMKSKLLEYFIFKKIHYLRALQKNLIGFPLTQFQPLFNANDVLETLYELLLRKGKPEYIRSDNGPEFIATALQYWLMKVGIKPIQIYPGSPWENGFNERFNGTLRREVLNVEWFHSIKQAQVAINIWLKQYNQIRPHHALNMRPPVPETLIDNHKINGTENWG